MSSSPPHEPLENTMPRYYSRTAIGLHWTVFALIATALAMGWIMTGMGISPLKLRVYSWHKWIGVTVLALFFVRGVWRLMRAPPPLLPAPGWQQGAAHALHAILYLFMFVQPLTGWMYSNATGYPIVYLGLIRLPNLVAKDKPLALIFEQIHDVGAIVLAAAIAIHALAALKHHVIDRDATLRRMLSSRQPVDNQPS
jgi:cytochrome b561